MTRVRRSEACDTSPEAQRAEAIALALMGAGEMPDIWLAENVVWDGPHGAVTGRAAIMGLRDETPVPEAVTLDEIVTHGKAGAVSGRITRAGAAPRLFCHMIRYTTAKGAEIAHLVTFEHAGPKR